MFNIFRKRDNGSVAEEPATGSGMVETVVEDQPSGFADRVLVCMVCGGSFLWTAGEREYYRDRGLSDPRRCRHCRRPRRAADKPLREGRYDNARA